MAPVFDTASLVVVPITGESFIDNKQPLPRNSELFGCGANNINVLRRKQYSITLQLPQPLNQIIHRAGRKDITCCAGRNNT